MRWAMEILSPTASNFSNSSWFLDESKRRTLWTPAENKAFENALARFDENTPDRWQKVAAMVPGKTVIDVIRQYKELEDDVSSIEAGLIPLPGYGGSSPFTLEWGAGYACDGYKQSYVRKPSGRNADQERKKGVPWTEEEHKLFLMGLEKYGKGDWRNISRNFVITRTPTQVASHAQKYFIRQLSGGKDKRRASIHDITTVSLNDHHHQTSSPDNNNSSKPQSSDQSSVITNQSGIQKPTSYSWNQSQPGGEKTVMAFGDAFAPAASYGSRPQVQRMQRGVVRDISFQMQSGIRHYPELA